MMAGEPVHLSAVLKIVSKFNFEKKNTFKPEFKILSSQGTLTSYLLHRSKALRCLLEVH